MNIQAESFYQIPVGSVFFFIDDLYYTGPLLLWEKDGDDSYRPLDITLPGARMRYDKIVKRVIK